MDAVRRSALMLHGLSEQDRSAILQRLSPVDREALNLQLQDLRMMGVPPDSALAREAIARAERLEHAESLRERVMRADAVRIYALLQNESDSIVALLLNSGSWPWGPSVQSMLPPHVRSRVKDAMQRLARPSPKLADAIVETIAHLLPASTEAASPKRVARLSDLPVVAARSLRNRALRLWRAA